MYEIKIYTYLKWDEVEDVVLILGKLPPFPWGADIIPPLPLYISAGLYLPRASYSSSNFIPILDVFI